MTKQEAMRRMTEEGVVVVHASDLEWRFRVVDDELEDAIEDGLFDRVETTPAEIGTDDAWANLPDDDGYIVMVPVELLMGA